MRVLVAEDNHVLQAMLGHMLRQLGASHVTTVNNGRDAVAAALCHPFDIVLMDVHMPEVGGLEAAHAIRTYESLAGAGAQNQKKLPIIAMSADATDDLEYRCLAVGMSGRLAKPFRKEQVAAILNAVATLS